MNRTRPVRDIRVARRVARRGARLALACVGALALIIGSTGIAAAQRTRAPLEDEPAVRHRLLLVKNRFELTPLFESTVNADFRHILGAGLKLEYHLSDMLSLGVIGVYGFSRDTGLVGKIVPTLETIDPSIDDGCMATPAEPNKCDPTREPSRDEFNAHLNEMPIHGAAFISITPWYGKLAAFSKAFVNFDFYFQAGVSFAQLTSDCPSTLCDDDHPGIDIPDPNPNDDVPAGEPRDNNPNNDPPLNDGNRFGLYLGGGIHVFVNEFIALDFTVRDYAFSDNPSGADFNADLAVTDDDSRFLHHLFFGFGISVMLPPGAKRTR
jgi:outer membrane beta-barrel protein